jgi:hypothetical protein
MKLPLVTRNTAAALVMGETPDVAAIGSVGFIASPASYL